MNLLLNAADATPPGGSVRLTVRSSADREAAEIEVCDTGPGVPAGLRERVFEPFFTTKEAGRGTGLGLTVCRSIIDRHRGTITLGTRTGRRMLVRGHPAAGTPWCDMERARVLVIDDEPAMLENCERLLTREGYACVTLGDPLRFRDVAREVQPDVIITDLRMPGADGMTILAAAVADEAARPVIVMTAYATVASAVTAVREGAFDYLTKPFTADQLLVAVERAARYRGLTVENRSLRRQVARSLGGDGILGTSPVMARLLEQAIKVAPTDASVLITGESGTGKDLVARFIHSHSLRKDGPFIAVDCAAMPDGLLESELFGHERGAFTGAVQRTKGLLADANGGTVFLDEIAELSTALQSKLLRVLEQRQMRRLGDSRLIELDIRVIAATNRDIERAVADGRVP